MGWRKIARCLVPLLLAMAALWPSLAQAREFTPTCHATTSTDRPPAADDWVCDGGTPDFRANYAYLRFAVDDRAPPPAQLVTRASHFSAIRIRAIDRDGMVREATWSMADGQLSGSGLDFALALPQITPATQWVDIRFDRSWTGPLVAEARLVDTGYSGRWPEGVMLLLAGSCGLIVTPLFLDLMFYRILRANFLVWHGVAVLGWLGLTLVLSGLATRLVPLSVTMASTALPVFTAIAVVGSTMFAANLFEAGKLSERMRLWLCIAAVAVAVNGLVYALKIPVLRPVGIDIYYGSFLFLIALFVAALTQALRRGSRAAVYQLVACTPTFAIAVFRILSSLGEPGNVYDGIVLFSVGYAFELIVATMGAADRFVVLRRERDQARAQADVLADVAERDALTGLLNRRAIESRFTDLFGQGYRALAVVDLDYFKDVNDDHGHHVGDAVLVACAAALDGENKRHSIAMRIGGEEFLLLMRGKDIAQRAEKLRQAITLHTARQVPGLSRPVTASVGLLELAGSVRDGMNFEEMYRRADALLYEAKNEGRNRMVVERLTACIAPDVAGPAALPAPAGAQAR